ncbi:neurogenic locus notch homolog protein 1 [Nematostella vectensis]|uniref:neurogenic locus notch homolog protein 1 n=1 Tax=Nematostella vectensis TaxID=45351 RepID=UPI002077063C|nr:neurogenic locus notch homolog protein 1 [Nematostella vectensis]
MKVSQMFSVLLFLTITLPQECSSCFSRRRRTSPPCQYRDCKVSGWSTWSSCNHRCGSAGIQTRTRSKTVQQQCGGSCLYPLSESRSCNRYCYNGGTPQQGYCSCKPGFTGTCCHNDINECDSSPCDHYCQNTYGSYYCSCKSCYTKYGNRCSLVQCAINYYYCHAYGAINPANPCQQCNSNNKFHWTNNNHLPCNDTNPTTKNDYCDNGVCKGHPYNCLPCETQNGIGCSLKPEFCVIEYNGNRKCFSEGTLNPVNPCQQCNSNDKFHWTNNNHLPCNDNNPTTKNDYCDNGVCKGHPYNCLPCETQDGIGCSLKPKYCVIEYNGNRTCFAGGTLNPGNPCQQCNSNDKFHWTNNNHLPCNDNNSTTKNDYCDNGGCKGHPYNCLPCETQNGIGCSLKPQYCVIEYNGNRKCFSEGTLNPVNPCQQCNSNDKFHWTNNNHLPCNDNNPTTKNDYCDNGVCKGHPYNCLPCETQNGIGCSLKPQYCVIEYNGNRKCFSEGTLNPGNPCQQCNGNNKFHWTNNNHLPCNDNNPTTKNDYCDNGVCKGHPYNCLPCETQNGIGCSLKPQYCVIEYNGNRKCFSEGTLNPGNPCQQCNGNNKFHWTNNNHLPCNDNNPTTKNDYCDNGACKGHPYNCFFFTCLVL